LVFCFVAAEGWTASKVPVEEQAYELAAGAKKAVHMYYVSLPESGVEGAKKRLFDDEIILSDELEEVACNDAQGWIGNSGESIVKAIGKNGRDIYRGNRREVMVQQPGCLVAVATAGDQDRDLFVL